MEYDYKIHRFTALSRDSCKKNKAQQITDTDELKIAIKRCIHLADNRKLSFVGLKLSEAYDALTGNPLG